MEEAGSGVRPGEPGNEGGKVITDIVAKFSMLPADEKTVALKSILEFCGPEQKWHLQQSLPDFLLRDFFGLLPDEVLEMILSYLDCITLLRAREVSKMWCNRLSSLPLSCVWQNVARDLGALKHEGGEIEAGGMFSHAHPWLRGCSFTHRLRGKIRTGSCFKTLTLNDLTKGAGNGRVTAVHCDVDSEIMVAAISSDDSGVQDVTSNVRFQGNHNYVVVWSLNEDKISRKISVSTETSVILSTKSGSIIVCGHNNGTVSCITPRKVENFHGHTSSVFSIDVSDELNLLATGSADNAVKFWDLNDRKSVRCISIFNDWVVKIILRSPSSHSVTRFQGKAILFSMTKDNITLHAWEDCQDVSHPHCQLKNLSTFIYQIPLFSKPFGLRDIFFTPGLHLFGDNLGFIKQMPMFETHTIGDADIVIVNACDGQLRNTIHVNKKVRKLLGIGSRFALLLLPYVDNRYKNLAIVDLKDRKIIGGFTVPHSRTTTPDLAQIAIGDTAWMDGINENRIKSKLLIGLATNYEPLHIVRWNDG